LTIPSNVEKKPGVEDDTPVGLLAGILHAVDTLLKVMVSHVFIVIFSFHRIFLSFSLAFVAVLFLSDFLLHMFHRSLMCTVCL